MLIVLDNAESILDPLGTNAQEIYMVVEELSQFMNLCILITSRISIIPPDCKHIDIPTLPMSAGRDTFYRIYDDDDPSDSIDNILEQLDFHPLSITLLATVSRQNRWDVKRLVKEWEQRRTGVLEAGHNKSLATTIELSLASPLFQQLGPDARSLLEVVAFFPRGVDENNLEWLFPTVPDRAEIFDKFCTLSLTYRNSGFVTMLAPLRDYLCPKDPKSSPVLCAAKERYFARMSVYFDPNDPEFVKTQWITSEDANVEHLLDVFTTIDASSPDVWKACEKFMEHLIWHKKRLTILGPKIEGLPDDDNSKPECLSELARLFDEVGNLAKAKRLHTHTLKLWRERGIDHMTAQTLRFLSDVDRQLGLCKEGIEQTKEAIEIHERLGDVSMQAECLIDLAFLLCEDKRLDEAEAAALRATSLIPEKGQEFRLCESHRVLGDIYQSKGETEKAISHFKTALEIATSFDWHVAISWIHHSLALLFRDEGRFQDAQAHTEHAEPYAVDNGYCLARARWVQASIWYKQHRLEEAGPEALRAADAFEKAGATRDAEECRKLLRCIQEELGHPVSSG